MSWFWTTLGQLRPEETLSLCLLLAGHVLGDFVFQTRAVVEAKRTDPAALAHHARTVTKLHVLCLLPFLQLSMMLPAVILLALLGFAHFRIDRDKIRREQRDERRGLSPRFRWWVLDQLLHLGAVLGIWFVLNLVMNGSDDGGWALGPQGRSTLRVVALWTIAFGFNVHGSSALVAALLDACERRSKPKSDEPASDEPEEAGDDVSADWTASLDSKAKKGVVIGVLERALILVLVMIQSTGAIGFVLAAKSVARFKDMDDRDFSEGYLVGTLASTLIAVASGVAVIWLVL